MAIADKLTQLNNVKLAIKQGLQSKLDLNLSSTPFTDYATQINTITNQGAVTKTFTPSGSSQSYTIPKGYHNGNGKVTCNAINLVLNASNYAKGKGNISASISVTNGATYLLFGTVSSQGAMNFRSLEGCTIETTYKNFGDIGWGTALAWKVKATSTTIKINAYTSGDGGGTSLMAFKL